MELELLKQDGKKASKKVKLDDGIFGIEPNDHAIYLDVKQIQANGRQGTHKAKERSEVAGSRKKLRKQKGTGGARRGDVKDPLLRGGGRIFGPRPRDYHFKLNKKVKRLARKSALSYKAKESGLLVVDDIKFAAPKTQDFKKMLSNLKLDDSKVLVVVSGDNENTYLSARNLQGAKVMNATDLNTYDIMNCKNILFTEGAITAVHEYLK
jgi:large subunit ribosomal protein L4